MKRGLPLFEAKITDNEEGMICISLVDSPAVEVLWQRFSDEKTNLTFKIDNEEKRIVRGVVMLADSPIYRRNGDFEFYITYSADTIRYMAEKYLSDGFQNKVDTQHNNQWIDGVNMTQIFFKDVESGINPKGFENVNDGSMFAEFKVHNDEIWDKIKKGEFQGFSLEGYFTIEDTNKMIEEQFNKEDSEEQEILDLIKQIENKLNR